MKPTRSGIWTIIIMLVGIPLTADLFLLPILINYHEPRAIMTWLMIGGYLGMMRWFVVYLLLAYLITKIVKWQLNRRSQKA